MCSKTPTGKAPKGSVQVISSNGRLQLRFRYGGKRHYLSTGLPDSPENLKAAELKAKQIELDIASGNFDSTLAKYKPESLLSISSPDITPKATPKLSEFMQYTRSTFVDKAIRLHDHSQETGYSQFANVLVQGC